MALRFASLRLGVKSFLARRSSLRKGAKAQSGKTRRVGHCCRLENELVKGNNGGQLIP